MFELLIGLNKPCTETKLQVMPQNEAMTEHSLLQSKFFSARPYKDTQLQIL